MPRLRAVAEKLIAEGHAPVSVVRRLACDERMRGVWSELNKRERDDYRKTDRPVYQATLPSAASSLLDLSVAIEKQAARERGFGRAEQADKFERAASLVKSLDRFSVRHVPSAEMRHEMALVALFIFAIARFVQKPETVTERELNAIVATEQAKGRDDVAAAYEALAQDPIESRFIVKRRRTDPRVEAYVESLALECRKLFGQDLYGVVATITNVVFDQHDMTDARIRTILRARTPAKSA
jgi:hypothetical protein